MEVLTGTSAWKNGTAALAVLIKRKDVLTGKAVIPAEKEITVAEPEPKPKRKLFTRR